MRHDPARVLNLRVPPELRPRLDALASARQTSRHQVAVSALLSGVDHLEAGEAVNADATSRGAPADGPTAPEVATTPCAAAGCLDELQRTIERAERLPGVEGHTPWRPGDPFTDGTEAAGFPFVRAVAPGLVAVALTPGSSGNLVSATLWRDTSGTMRATVRYAGRVCVEAVALEEVGGAWTVPNVAALVRVKVFNARSLPDAPAEPLVITLAAGGGALREAVLHRAGVALAAVEKRAAEPGLSGPERDELADVAHELRTAITEERAS